MASLSEWLTGVMSSLGGTSTASFSGVQKTINGSDVSVTGGDHGNIVTHLLQFSIMNRIDPDPAVPNNYRVSIINCQVETTIPNGFDVEVSDKGTFTSTQSTEPVSYYYSFTQVLSGHEETFTVLVGAGHADTINVTVVNLTPSKEYTLGYTQDGTASSVKATSTSSGMAFFKISGALNGQIWLTTLA